MKKEIKQLSIIIKKEDKWFVAVEKNTSIAAQGMTVRSCLTNLGAMLDDYLADPDTKLRLLP